MTTPLTLEAMEAKIRAMTPEQKRALAANPGVARRLARPWNPQPGPQTAAYNTPADETLYGGAAGGGGAEGELSPATSPSSSRGQAAG